ncbi:Hsp70 family protein [Thermomonospora curvata]|uniref:Heat shock protein 70 n=1 Tax=Thermomonospora curvata (strain ATCC 19995 / DSM 43183 / JCM 3096 / KCTC 9072 / NBRC 15933 / NCIMB 10081 / Henssen B9) TaxID=471852 RepID=D1AA48_THECD|nr:Hsp70 family protein [Thermomonospora curvata]ACY96984.1 Heat shock protein 70 [Thermomonospora curvata DSM 43183]
MTPFGIDLGTTNSCIAYVDESGRPVVVKNALGEETTPSAVYFERAGHAVIGSAARNSALLAPHLVVQSIKRQMGRPDAEYTFHGERFTPEKISALLLRRLAVDAERQTAGPVRDVVITVPAYFGVAEREATRRAGRIAGLNVVDLLDEPVAAALSRLRRQPVPGVRHLLVYDLGGGTFDTTVIEASGQDIRVVCTDGDLRLGGTDWDERIIAFLTAAFTEQTGLDPTADEHFMQEVRITAEQLKKELSSTVSRHRNLRFAGAVARVELSRQRLEELTADLLDRTMEITARTVEKARAAGVDRIDEVLLVGGMTKMPVIAERLEELLGLRPHRHERDLAVARGAALFALTRQARTAGGRSDGGAEEVADRLGITAAEGDALVARRVAGVLPPGHRDEDRRPQGSAGDDRSAAGAKLHPPSAPGGHPAADQHRSDHHRHRSGQPARGRDRDLGTEESGQLDRTGRQHPGGLRPASRLAPGAAEGHSPPARDLHGRDRSADRARQRTDVGQGDAVRAADRRHGRRRRGGRPRVRGRYRTTL